MANGLHKLSVTVSTDQQIGLFKSHSRQVNSLKLRNNNVADAAILWEKSQVFEQAREDGVADGTRTRNNQNHNLGIYH